MSEVSIRPTDRDDYTVWYDMVQVGYIHNSRHYDVASFAAYMAFYKFGPAKMKQIMAATREKVTLLNITRRLMS